jgi:ATP-binding cassette, subfamily B, bacterial
LSQLPSSWFTIPTSLRAPIESQLQEGESVASWFRPDLDERLHYADGLVVLTSQRLFSITATNKSTPTDASGTCRSWELSSIESMRTGDRRGLGTLEIYGPKARLGCWKFTINHAGGAKDLVEQFEDIQAGVTHSHPLGEDAAETAYAEPPPAPPDASALFRLFQFARPHAGAILLGILLTFGTTAAGLIPPYLTMPLVDNVFLPFQDESAEALEDPQLSAAERAQKLALLRDKYQSRFRTVPWYLAGFAGAALIAWGLGWAQGWVLARVSERISADLRNATYGHLQKLSLDFFGGKRTGDLVARISSDTDRLCGFLSDNLVDFVTDVLMIIGTAAVLLSVDPLLALATLCTFPFIAWFTFRIRDTLTHGFLHGGRAWSEMTSILADTIPGIRVVKAFAQERREVDRFHAANDRIVAANDRVNKVWTFYWPLVALLNQVGLLVVWAFGAWQVFNHRVTVGMLVLFLQYIGRFYMRLESMSRMATSTQRAAASAQRIFEILDRAPSVPEPANPVRPGKLHGQIELKHVGFRYGNRQVLEEINLSIRPGEVIGLVGTTGAGKSTLVNLVCRFYDVSEGSILVDGHDVRSLDLADFRRNIGMVLQEPFLFFGTIADNIAYGRPDATREEIVAAARAARAHEFILQLPDGYDSMVGERGQSLSGGERQRISIARALLIDPRILILDEATSAVDTETERQIQAALDTLIQGRTTIAIAHRLSTLRKADRLLVLQRGRIVEVGSHAELIDRGGLYAGLYHAQMLLARDGET